MQYRNDALEKDTELKAEYDALGPEYERLLRIAREIDSGQAILSEHELIEDNENVQDDFCPESEIDWGPDVGAEVIQWETK